jgi:hypothetical protein
MGAGLTYVLEEELDKSSEWSRSADLYSIRVSQGW